MKDDSARREVPGLGPGTAISDDEWRNPARGRVPPGTSSALYVGRVMHQRLRPRRHRLSYRLYTLLVDLDEFDALHGRLRLLSVGRFNLFGLDARDYGDGSGRALRAQAEGWLRAAGLPAPGAIRLLTMPRVLGHLFNPITVWYCHAADNDGLMAVVYEVDNTFGERHRYLMPVAPAQASAACIDQACAKQLYVSPFNAMDQRYAFRVASPGEALALGISVHAAEGAVLNARLDAERRPLTDAALLRVFLTHPLVTLKVVAAIHWEALKLWLKGVPLQPRPRPPAEALTIVPPSHEAS